MIKYINPQIVPKVKIYSGEEIPGIGMGTFGSDRFNAEQVSNAVAGAIRCGYIPIPFSVHEANYVSNLKCLTEDPLSDEEMKIIAGLEKNNRLVKGQVFLWEGAKDWHDLWDEDGVIVT